jgi:hypothetical protein
MNTIPDTATRQIDLEQALERARADYHEMPGLKLTAPQASRLWGLHPTMCDRVLRSLLEEHFLNRVANDSFVMAR